MSESEVGLRVATTRQKAGRFVSGLELPAGVKAPASIVVATVIDTVGDTSFERPAQDCAWSTEDRNPLNKMTRKSTCRFFMIGLYLTN
jgi:hypothetical protein